MLRVAVPGALVPGAADVLTVCAAADADWPAPAADAAPEQPVSASPAATPSAAIPSTGTPNTGTPNTGPNVTSGVLSLIRTCMLLNAVSG